MSETAEWVAWVGPARKGDRAAADQLVQYFSPFVHAVLLSKLSHRAAGAQVKGVLEQAIYRLGGLKEDAGFGAWLLIATRERAFDAAKAPGATVDAPGADPLINEGHQVLAKIRALAETPRERLLMRLLEGIPGFEISEVTGSDESLVRADLERAASTLVQQLTAQPAVFTHDSYLWSLVGTPHPALIPLENQLTPLRYSAAAHDDDATPSDPGTPLPPPPMKITEGHRPTGQGPALGRADRAELKTDPRPQPLPPPVPERTDPHADELQTGAVRIPTTASTIASLPPVQSANMPEPPANPFGTSVKTIHASDLPAAADFGALQDLQDQTRPEAVEPFPQGNDDDDPATLVQNLPPVAARAPAPSRSKSDEPADARDLPTQVRPSGSKARAKPLTVDHSAEEQQTALKPVRPSQPGGWKSSSVVGAPEPLPTVMGLPAVIVKRGSVARSWRPFAIAGTFGAIALGVALLLFDGTTRRVKAGWTLVPVVVAATDLTEGTQVSIEMVSQRAVPEQFVTSSVIRPDSAQYVVNQKILVGVQAGDPLLWTQFEATRGAERLSKKVMKRARAYDLMTNKSIAVGGWVQPNDRIDIIASLKGNEKGSARVAVTLLQDIPVLSTGKITTTTLEAAKKDGDKDYIDVSVLLLPEEAELVALATEVGELQFTLRHDDDHDVLSDHRGSNSKTLLQGERVKLLQQKRLRTIQQIRNTKSP